VCPEALLFANTPASRHEQVQDTYCRGSRGHSFEVLKEALKIAKCRMPVGVTKAFQELVEWEWSTDLRYGTGYLPYRKARRFFETALEVYRWAERNL